MKSKGASSSEFAKCIAKCICDDRMSCYIFGRYLFISKAVGANSITALNLVLPLYNLIFAIGSMIGVGSAINLPVAKNQKESNKHHLLF